MPLMTGGSKTTGAAGSYVSATSKWFHSNRAYAARWSRAPNPASHVTSTSTAHWPVITAATSASGPQYARAARSPRTTSRISSTTYPTVGRNANSADHQPGRAYGPIVWGWSHDQGRSTTRAHSLRRTCLGRRHVPDRRDVGGALRRDR